MLLLISKIVVSNAVAFGVLWFFARQLATKNGGDVRIITYLFAFAATITYVVACGAEYAGAIDARGNFMGTAGKHLQASLHAMLDLQTDLFILFGIAVVAIVPQVISYLLAGLVGCARAPIFVGPVLRTLFWFAVKSFATAGGIVLALTIFGVQNSWSGVASMKGFVLAFFGVAMLIISFAYVFLYRSICDGIKLPKWLLLLRKIDKWLSRAPGNSACDPTTRAVGGCG